MEKGLLAAVKLALLITGAFFAILLGFAFPPLLGIALPVGFFWAVTKLLGSMMGGGDDD
ncbi:hypothetical protein [Burkholderia gladioli]|nr:hypothetical protein [Burkholderia gladioli]HDR8993908.1 hypothetical protein [Burkholderia vietnamiensis]